MLKKPLPINVRICSKPWLFAEMKIKKTICLLHQPAGILRVEMMLQSLAK